MITARVSPLSFPKPVCGNQIAVGYGSHFRSRPISADYEFRSRATRRKQFRHVRPQPDKIMNDQDPSASSEKTSLDSIRILTDAKGSFAWNFRRARLRRQPPIAPVHDRTKAVEDCRARFTLLNRQAVLRRKKWTAQDSPALNLPPSGRSKIIGRTIIASHRAKSPC